MKKAVITKIRIFIFGFIFLLIGQGHALANIGIYQSGMYTDRISITWSSGFPGANYYELHSSPSGALIYTTTGNSFTHSGLQPAGGYLYYVISKNSSGVVDVSQNSSPLYTSPVTPTNVSATQGTVLGKSALSWVSIPNSYRYDIYRSTVSGSKGTVIATISTTTYNDITVSGSSHYFYTVVGQSSVGYYSGDSIQVEGWGGVFSAVSGVTATQGTVTGKATVSWATNPDAVNYDIYRSTTSGNQGSVIASNVTATTYDDTSVTAGTHYFYTIIAKNSGASSPASSQTEGWAKIFATTSGVTATQGTVYGKSTVSWTANPDAASYDIYRSTVSGSQGSTIATDITTASYSDATVSSSTHYFYTIVAKNSIGTAPASNQAEGWAKIFATTSGVTATQGTVYGKSTVSWTANPDATSYDIYRSTVSGTQGGVIVSNVTATSYDDTTVTAGTHYFYTVIAKNGTASAPVSNQAEGWGAALTMVTNVNATQGTIFSSIKISFSYHPSASGYDIYRSTTAGSQGSVIGTVCGGNTVACQMYNDTTVSGSTHYFYTVIAKNGSGGTSPPSNQVEGWAKVFATTSGVTATQGTVYGKSTVSWTANPDAASYDIYRSTVSGTQGGVIASNVTATSYDDTTVTAGTHYFYTVVAKNGTDSAPASSQAQGWSKVLGAVTGLSATQGTQTGKITLAWTADSGADSYEVWRSTSAGSTTTKITTITAPTATFDDATVSGVASYFYTVKMKAGALVSPASNEVEGWANAAPTSAAVSLTAGSLSASPATPPTITDPNITAGKTETFTLYSARSNLRKI